MIDEDIILSDIKTTIGKKFKRHGKTKYKYVYVVSYDSEMTYRAELSKYKFSKCFSNCRDAAIAVDKKLIEIGLKPVNILIKK